MRRGKTDHTILKGSPARDTIIQWNVNTFCLVPWCQEEVDAKGKRHPFVKVTLPKLRFPSHYPLVSVSVYLCTLGGDVNTLRDAWSSSARTLKFKNKYWRKHNDVCDFFTRLFFLMVLVVAVLLHVIFFGSTDETRFLLSVVTISPWNNQVSRNYRFPWDQVFFFSM